MRNSRSGETPRNTSALQWHVLELLLKPGRGLPLRAEPPGAQEKQVLKQGEMALYEFSTDSGSQTAADWFAQAFVQGLEGCRSLVTGAQDSCVSLMSHCSDGVTQARFALMCAELWELQQPAQTLYSTAALRDRNDVLAGRAAAVDMTSSAPCPLAALLLPKPRALCLFVPSVSLFAADPALLLPVYGDEQVSHWTTLQHTSGCPHTQNSPRASVGLLCSYYMTPVWEISYPDRKETHELHGSAWLELDLTHK